MPLAFIQFLDGSRMPVDPGFGVGEGGNPDNTLPVPNPPDGAPGHLPSVPPGWPVIPSHPIVRPPHGGKPDNSLPVIPNPPPGTPGNLPAVPPGWPIVPTHPWIPPRHGLHPDNSLPGEPGHPDQGLPAIPGVPDNSLPTTPPPTVPPGMILVIVRTADGKWKWATVSSPPTTLPEPPPTPQPKS